MHRRAFSSVTLLVKIKTVLTKNVLGTRTGRHCSFPDRYRYETTRAVKVITIANNKTHVVTLYFPLGKRLPSNDFRRPLPLDPFDPGALGQPVPTTGAADDSLLFVRGTADPLVRFLKYRLPAQSAK